MPFVVAVAAAVSRLRLPATLAASWFVAMCAASSAQAQTVTLQTEIGDRDVDGEVTFNLRSCRSGVSRSSLSFRVDFPSTLLGDGLEYAVYRDETGSACNVPSDSSSFPASSDGCQRVIDPTDLVTQVVYDDDSFSTWTGVGSEAECEGYDMSPRVFVLYQQTDTADDTTSLKSVEFNLIFQTTRPNNTVEGVTATAGESSIKVSFSDSVESDEQDYAIYYSTTAPPEDGLPETWSDQDASSLVDADSPETLTEGISVNNTYYVAVVVVDSYGNESALNTSEVIEVTTQPTNDFYELYVGAGGQDKGFQCSALPASKPARGLPWAGLLLGAVAVGAARRRRAARRLGATSLSAFFLGLLVLGLASPAMAQTDKRPSEGVFSFKLGSYLPGVDEAPGLTAKPYELAFGDETMLLLEGQLEKPLYQGVGLLSVAFNLGYMSVDGKARTQSGAASTDTTDLTIVPVRAGLLYRFDFFSKGYDVPLVPTIGAGLDWHLWWSNNTKDEIASAGDGEAIGGVWGWHGSVGLALLLDWFDTSSATSMLLDFDIINSYLFAEFTTNRIDGFGAEDSLRLSDDAWLFGLSFEY